MPGRPQRTVLSEDMWKAIKLAEEGTLGIGEIAAAVGWSTDYFYDLRQGNVEKGGSIAPKFAEEYTKAEEKRDKETRRLLKQNQSTAQKLLTRILVDYSKQKTISKEDKKLIGTLTNCLNNCTPAVSIKTTSFNYVQGLNPQDLISEFKRLKGIAESSFNRPGVRATFESGSGRIPEIDESGM